MDHENGDRLDNRRSNLRLATYRTNAQNRSASGNRTTSGRPTSSQYRGVSWSKEKRRWVAHVTVDRKMRYLGAFESEEQADAVATEARARLMPFSRS